jgi:Raf kinase inhibitor-like YbhB/YbcL family protein
MALFIDKLAITSPDIQHLARIANEFTADGGNVIPALRISGGPEGTVEFALFLNDPDAPLPHGFTNWSVYGIPALTTVLDTEDVSVRVGPNGMGEAAYSGPQPPFGHGEHHYFFWLYALNRNVFGEPTREEFLAEYADAIIEQARLVGVYQR